MYSSTHDPAPAMQALFLAVTLLPAPLGAQPSSLQPPAASQRAAAELQRETVARATGASRALQHASVARQAGAADNAFFQAPWVVTFAESVSAAVQIGLPSSANNDDCNPLPEEEMNALIEEAAVREGFTPDLLRAVIHQESSFRPCAVSPKGALGLMQLMPATATQFGVEDPFDPEENITAGSRLLGQLLSRYGGDLARALSAYNAGVGRADRSRIPAIAETQKYVRDILNKLGMPRALFNPIPMIQ